MPLLPRSRPALRRWLPFLAWPRLTRGLLAVELTAGITVGLMLVPQGLAYAQLAGMPAVTGIYACLAPALVAVLWSSSHRLGVGPTALTSLLVGASLAELAQPGSPQWIALAVWLALMSGAVQLLLGAVRFGWLLNIITAPVLAGFTQAASILIFVSQLPPLVGLRGEFDTLLAHPDFHLPDTAFGLGGLAALILLRRWRPRFPAAMAAVAVAAVVSWALDYAQGGGAVVGTVPAGLPAPSLPPALPRHLLGALVMPALAIALVSFLETASSAKVDTRLAGRQWDENQDLIGQGLSKLAAAFSGSFPTSASFSRSALNLHAGARSGWATLFAVALVLAVLLVATPALYYVPQPVLAALVVAAVTNLFNPSEVLRLARISRVEAATWAVTFALTLVTSPQLYWGVLAGILMSLSHFLYLRLHPRIIEVGLHPDGSLRDRHLWQLPPLAGRLYALRMDAELDFASAAALERNVAAHIDAHPRTAHVCLFAQPINRIDATGVEAFARIRTLLHERGIALHVSGLKLPVDTVLRGAGELPDGPLLHLYRTDIEALGALARLDAMKEGGAT
ncbi:SulP family inorganic anion transporter [Xylophilus sp.]|uniref:SulP family inorganic anion transporter n=1 Tax=Xylophilus sp. TaxID=2653893 RepID=UPI0013BDE4A5|nr:SulP family inorganic anion transporter [Xylophilus sp.]KAF1049836.1 MAG: putative sulfate transporter [Xylophilus sp.]